MKLIFSLSLDHGKGLAKRTEKKIFLLAQSNPRGTACTVSVGRWGKGQVGVLPGIRDIGLTEKS